MEDKGLRIEDGGLMTGDGYRVEVGLWWNALRATKRCIVVSVVRRNHPLSIVSQLSCSKR